MKNKKKVKSNLFIKDSKVSSHTSYTNKEKSLEDKQELVIKRLILISEELSLKEEYIIYFNQVQRQNPIHFRGNYSKNENISSSQSETTTDGLSAKDRHFLMVKRYNECCANNNFKFNVNKQCLIKFNQHDKFGDLANERKGNHMRTNKKKSKSAFSNKSMTRMLKSIKRLHQKEIKIETEKKSQNDKQNSKDKQEENEKSKQSKQSKNNKKINNSIYEIDNQSKYIQSKIKSELDFLAKRIKNIKNMNFNLTTSTDHDKKSKHVRIEDVQHVSLPLNLKIFNFVIVKQLGEGTFGKVYEVIDQQQRRRALKIIKPHIEYICLAMEEAYMSESIYKIFNLYANRSSVVNIYDNITFIYNNQTNFGILYEELGMSLNDLLNKNLLIGLPIRIIQKISKQLLETLDFLHGCMNIIHSDLKPENILLKEDSFMTIDSNEVLSSNKYNLYLNTYIKSKKTLKNYLLPDIDTLEVKLIDFGCAILPSDNHSGIINTRQYRSPEVIFGGDDWNTKSDIWSLGCVLYELYTGDLLFHANENFLHIGLIEKIIGDIPVEMIVKSSLDDLNKLYNELKYKGKKTDGTEYKPKYVLEKTGKSLYCNVNTIAEADVKKKGDAIERLRRARHIDEFISNKNHIDFLDFLKGLLRINPKERVSAKEALGHRFFSVCY